MEWGGLTEDQLIQVITQGEAGVARLRAMQMAAISELRSRKANIADGYRSIIDWVAARADVSHQTARRLTWTATRLSHVPEIASALADGEITFDRVEQVARLPERHHQNHEDFDIAQLKRRVAHYRRLSPRRERQISNGFLHFQPSLDETTTHMWGELSGLDARTVQKAIDQYADEVIGEEAGLSVAERRALGLVAACQDSLYTETPATEAPTAELTVTVDARTAAECIGQTGVWVLEGSRIGTKALEAVLCNAVVHVIGVTEDGEPLDLGRRTRTISPKLRRHVLTRDHGCTVEGCSSRYRLEAHHVQPWSHGGPTNTDNLLTLCWYHHHIAVHREGMTIYRIGTSRVRLKRQPRGSPPATPTPSGQGNQVQ